ncbi:hypothetical protein [Streptosporangium sp. KLBMP 9127]|nr:hypothetical protein [Streptosporangium sp. KLBMP 9127]
MDDYIIELASLSPHIAAKVMRTLNGNMSKGDFSVLREAIVDTQALIDGLANVKRSGCNELDIVDGMMEYATALRHLAEKSLSFEVC